MSQFVRMEGKHTAQRAHCALRQVTISVHIASFVEQQKLQQQQSYLLLPALLDHLKDESGSSV